MVDCVNCRYFTKDGSLEVNGRYFGVGRCRIAPPTRVDSAGMSIWPKVFEGDSCGMGRTPEDGA